MRDDRLELAYRTPTVLIGPPEEVPLLSDSPLARAVADKQAKYLGGADGDPFGRAGANDHSSWAILPLVVRDESVSVAAVAYPGAQGIESNERVFLSSMAELAAQAMHRSRLHQQELALAQMASFFAQAARVIAEASDFADTLGRLAELALAALGDICLIDVVGEDGRPRRMVARHREPDRQRLVDRLGRDYPPEADGVHPAVEVIRTGKTRWSGVMSDEFLRATTRDDAHFALVRELEFRSYLSVPLVADTTTLGALTLVSGSRPFRPEDVRFAERLAEQVAAVVDNARRYEATLRTSHVLQQSLLPQRLPEVPGLQIATRYLPATRGLDVGGDFYDLVTLPNGNVAFVVGDVEGHDRDAAALMGHLRSAARALAGQFETPSQVIAALQQSWQLLGLRPHRHRAVRIVRAEQRGARPGLGRSLPPPAGRVRRGTVLAGATRNALGGERASGGRLAGSSRARPGAALVHRRRHRRARPGRRSQHEAARSRHHRGPRSRPGVRTRRRVAPERPGRRRGAARPWTAALRAPVRFGPRSSGTASER